MSKSIITNDWSGGVDNLAPSDRAPAKFVREAVNVDPTPGGALHLRTGYAMARACNSAAYCAPSPVPASSSATPSATSCTSSPPTRRWSTTAIP
ncbi:hypothetical protein D3C85_600260 [compost metagenome]